MRKGHYSTEAIILNSFDYGESDRILAFYTKEFGKLRGIAKGARRSKRRFVGNICPPSYVNLLFYRGNNDLAMVEEASLIYGFPEIKGDVSRYADSCYILELANEMTRDGGHQKPELFEVLLCFLKLVNFSGGSKSLLRFYEIKLLATLGYMPHLSGCVVCREDFSGGRVFFNSEKGGAVCGVCSGRLNGLIPFSAATASLLGMAGRMPAEKLSRLITDEAFTKESEAVLSDFIRHQTGRELKTKKIIERLGM